MWEFLYLLSSLLIFFKSDSIVGRSTSFSLLLLSVLVYFNMSDRFEHYLVFIIYMFVLSIPLWFTKQKYLKYRVDDWSLLCMLLLFISEVVNFYSYLSGYLIPYFMDASYTLFSLSLLLINNREEINDRNGFSTIFNKLDINTDCHNKIYD